MRSRQTMHRLEVGLRLLKRDQERGAAPPPGAVTRADIARRAGLSKAVIRDVERLFAARLAAAILADPDCPRQMARMASTFLSRLSL